MSLSINSSSDASSAASETAVNAASNAASGAATSGLKSTLDFVNLYDILKVQVSAGSSDLRKRITEMYLEAQKNLDHRNLQKKMYFQQMYETYLPQARHILLDTKRRQEYDTYLAVYKEDQIKRASVDEVLTARENQENASKNREAVLENIDRPIESLMSPEELAAYRADQWNKWQESLNSSSELAQLEFSPVELEMHAVERRDYIERVMVEVREESKRMEAERERLHQEELARREIEQQKAREAEFERRRLAKFEEDSNSLILTARLNWAFGVGAACFLLGFSLLFVLDVYFSSRGNDRDTFRLICLALTAAACAFGGWRGAAFGTSRIKRQLAQRPNLHVEAEKRAAKIIADRKKLDGDPKALKPGQAVREAELLQVETAEQIRVMRHADLNTIANQNLSTGWSFGMGEGVFALGFALIFLIDMGLARSGSASRPVVAFGGWFFTLAASLVAARAGAMLARKKAPIEMDASEPKNQPKKAPSPEPQAQRKPQAH